MSYGKSNFFDNYDTSFIMIQNEIQYFQKVIINKRYSSNYRISVYVKTHIFGYCHIAYHNIKEINITNYIFFFKLNCINKTQYNLVCKYTKLTNNNIWYDFVLLFLSI